LAITGPEVVAVETELVFADVGAEVETFWGAV